MSATLTVVFQTTYVSEVTFGNGYTVKEVCHRYNILCQWRCVTYLVKNKPLFRFWILHSTDTFIEMWFC